MLWNEMTVAGAEQPSTLGSDIPTHAAPRRDGADVKAELFRPDDAQSRLMLMEL